MRTLSIHGRVRRIAWLVHVWSGVGLGLYVTAVCLTGSLLVYKDGLERRTGRGYLPVTGAERRHSWQDLYETVRRAYPNATFTHLEFGRARDHAPFFRVVLSGDRLYVFVDPHTNTILGVDSPSNGVTAFLYDLHVNLLAGSGGRTVNGFGAIAILTTLAAGLVVWWPHRGSWHRGFLYDPRARWQRQTVRLHRLTGASTSVLLIVLMVTATCLTFGTQFRRAASAVSPPGAWFDVPAVRSVRAETLSIDRLIDEAQRALPNATPRMLRFAATPTASWHVRLELPGDWSRSGDNFVYIDQYSGYVLRREIHRELPFAIRVLRSQAPLHFGSFAGSVSQLLWAVAGFIGAALASSGTVMFWARTRSASAFRARVARAAASAVEAAL
jgi:uncharacterized iron-regulated membrane protein